MTIGIEANHANKEQRTGVENYCWYVIKNLKKQIPSDARVILYTQEPLLPELLSEMPKNWEVKILKWPFKKLWSQFRLSFELFKNKPDVFFAPGQLIPFFCPTKTVVTVHDSAFMLFPKAYRFFGRQYLKWMNKRIARVANKILTPSQFSKDEFIKLYKFPEQNVIVTPLGYNQDIYFDYTKNYLKPDLSFLHTNKPFIFYVGRLEEKKNTLALIHAFEKVKKDYDIALVLAGKPGCGYEKISIAIENSVYKNDIVLPGWLSDKQISECFNQAEIFVFPSFYEGFGLPLLEAMACNCPILASKGHSLEEVGNDAVEYFDPQNKNELVDKLIILLGDKNKRDFLRQKGLERVQNYSWEKTAELTAKILCGLHF